MQCNNFEGRFGKIHRDVRDLFRLELKHASDQKPAGCLKSEQQDEHGNRAGFTMTDEE
ncbi:MAG: hypothetical protein EPGJADBJ_05515 [Saprospiraceae bacterium]|nr:hypothetical protein [Saprospiraceae bacterium]